MNGSRRLVAPMASAVAGLAMLTATAVGPAAYAKVGWPDHHSGPATYAKVGWPDHPSGPATPAKVGWPDRPPKV